MLGVSLDIKELVALIQAKWHRRSSLLIVLLLVVLVLFGLFSGISVEKISLSEFIIVVLSLTIVILIWLSATMAPKASKGKAGFAVAISTDTKEQREKIAQDFVVTLRDLLFKSNLKYHFSFIEFPEHHALKIKNANDARRYLHISKCLFMIYGRARVREIKGKDHHVLNMEGIVAHGPISQEIRKRFSTEFAELFPRKLLLSSENDLFVFEFTSEWVNLVARYIIGIASLLSGDVEYSQSLFEDLQEKAKGLQTNFAAIVKIRQRLPVRLTEVYLTQARIKHAEWRQTRDLEPLDRMKLYLGRLETVAPNDYGGNLLRAIWHFAANRDVPAAKREVRKCYGQKDATWRYSYAFLFAYEGDMKQAVRLYRSAFRHHCEDQVLLEVEEFICWVLEQEPAKVQLHFCLGLINLRGKGDKARALQDFERFLQVAPRAQFSTEIGLAEVYIGNIQEQLNRMSS